MRHYDYHEVHRQRAARVVVVIAVTRVTDTANRITTTAGRDIRHSHNATVTAISVPLCAVDSSGDHHLSLKGHRQTKCRRQNNTFLDEVVGPVGSKQSLVFSEAWYPKRVTTNTLSLVWRRQEPTASSSHAKECSDVSLSMVYSSRSSVALSARVFRAVPHKCNVFSVHTPSDDVGAQRTAICQVQHHLNARRVARDTDRVLLWIVLHAFRLNQELEDVVCALHRTGSNGPGARKS